VALHVDDLLERASRLLNDESRVRWTSTELIEWINDGQYAICARYPAAYSNDAAVSLVAGVRQTLPSGATRLLSVECNGTDGATVTACDRTALDAAIPDWRSADYADTTVVHYMYDPIAHPREFLIFPAQPTGTTATLTAVLAMDPPSATAATTLPLEEKYRDSLVNYMLFRALSKDAEEGSGAMATGYFQAFELAVDKASGNVAK
jgi:hypothetical protein